MSPESCLAAIDDALMRARRKCVTDVTIRLDWVDYRELIKLKGIEATAEQKREWEGQTGLTTDCTLPVATVRRVPVHVNKPPEYSSVVRGVDQGVVTAFVIQP